MIRTRRWNDPAEKNEGTKILICRYRPRGVKKSDETWDEWVADLGPSRELLGDFHEQKVNWSEYKIRYLHEMKETKPQFYIRALKQRIASGESITLLCSSACTDENHCHRTLLKSLIESAR